MLIDTRASAGAMPPVPVKKVAASHATRGGPMPSPIRIVHMNMIAMAVALKWDGTVNWFEMTITLLQPDSEKIITPRAATDNSALGIRAARLAERQPSVEAVIAARTSPSRRPRRTRISASRVKKSVPSALATTPVAP